MSIQRTILPSMMKDEETESHWVGVSNTVKEDGSVSLDLGLVSGKAPVVWNSAENTRCFYPDKVFPASEHQRATSRWSFLGGVEEVPAKAFFVSRYAKEILARLNATDPSATDKMVEAINLYFTELKNFRSQEKTKESKMEFPCLPPEFEVELVNPLDEKQCEELSQFELNHLAWFRKIEDDQTLQEKNPRYRLDGVKGRLATPGIYAFTVKKSGVMLGTLTLNLHTSSEAPEDSAYFGYLSDLFVAKGLDKDRNFNVQMFGSIFKRIAEKFPSLEVLSVMAAAGDPEIPIVKCFNYAKQAGLLSLFTRAKQELMGVVAHLIKATPEKAGRAHLPALKEGFLKMLSLWAYKKTGSEEAATTVCRPDGATRQQMTKL